MEKEQKEKKPRKYYVRKFFKEIKMIRWPDGKKMKSSFIIILLFCIVFVLAVFGLSIVIDLAFKGIGI